MGLGTDFTNDAPLTAWRGGRYAQKPNGESSVHQRHPASTTVSAGTIAGSDPGVEGMGMTTWYDPTNGNAPITRIVTVDDDGNPTIQWIDKDGNDVSSNSANFTPATAQTDSEVEIMYATVTDVAAAEAGRVRELRELREVTEGVLAVSHTFVVDGSDATAFVASAETQLSAAPIQVQLPTENLDVTGAAAIALAAIPQFASYAEVYIDASADDTNIRWTQDASAPADDNGEQEGRGTTIILNGRESIDGFRALTIDGAGALDPALTASLTVSYFNIAPDED